MTVGELIELFRLQAEDTVGPYFWSDLEIVAFLNNAVREACERAKLIEDVETANLAPGEVFCNLHPSVFESKRVTCDGRLLEESSVDELDRNYVNWESQKGLPRYYVFVQANAVAPAKLRLVPTPNKSMIVKATVYRGARTELTLNYLGAIPEINPRFHTHLLYWVLHQAFMRPDAEVFDARRAADSLAMFEQSFGARVDANVQRKQRSNREPVVRCSW